MEIVIDSEEDLHSAITRVREFGASRAYLLRLGDLSPEENLSMQDRINLLASACGCSSAAVTSLLITFGYLAQVIRTGLESSGGLITVSVVFIVLFLVSGAIGKIAGLLYSQWQLRRTLAELLGRVTVAN